MDRDMINNALHLISVTTTEDTSLHSNSYLYVIVWQCSHTSQLFEGDKYSFFYLVMRRDKTKHVTKLECGNAAESGQKNKKITRMAQWFHNVNPMWQNW